jgi:hypothetical protein
MRLRYLLFACTAAAMALPATGVASSRMLIGFQDDPTLRWRADRTYMFDRVRDHGATIVRTTVYWSKIAPTRPSSASNGFDPTYQFADLDEFVHNAVQRGMEVMLTIWGTPGWANGGKGQNFAPTNMADLQSFAHAVASRYSGHNPGIPFVHYYTVWNESNLGQFLSPQYDSKDKPAAPFIYAEMYRAAYSGIKSASPSALIGLGETSARGRDRALHTPGLQETESPGRFAELLSTVKPALRFDAWSQHPYPTELTSPPFQKVKWPAVTLASLPRLESSLDMWFHRKNTPVWVTEYGYQTPPGQPKGVSPATQAAYMKQAVKYVAADPRVTMFIWFVFRDDPTSTWQSGVLAQNSGEKPASNMFASLAKLIDARSPIFTIKAGTSNPTVRIPVLEFEGRDGPGGPIYTTTRSFIGTVLQGVSQPTGAIGLDGFVSLPLPIKSAQKGKTYTITFDLADQHGNRLQRTATIIVQ